MPITPDTKNWTWVLEKPCPECGYDAAGVGFRDIPKLVRLNAAAWPARLEQPDSRDRPDDATWSPLEYGAHVRDVLRVMQSRLRLMLDEDSPAFPDWDQDATALNERYGDQDPSQVSADLVSEAHSMAALLEAISDDELGRPGLRSDGSAFTVESLALYFLHDPTHHLHDVHR